MIKVVTDRKLIEKYQKQFQAQLDRVFKTKIYCWIGYHGGSWEDTVSYASDQNLWTCNFEHKDKKINLFGIGLPIENKIVSITGQINFPVEGINRRVAGVFAIDNKKKVLILHRGKIGGGKPGVGKNLFMENFHGGFIEASDGDRDSVFGFVGELESEYLPRQISDFIDEIARIKSLDKSLSSEESMLNTDFSYTDEHSGIIVTEKNEPRIINRTHGIIVKALSRELLDKNFNVGNDRNRDLFIHKKNQITTLFEVKSSASTQNLYTAVGQLLIYSIPIENKVNLIAVLPVKLNKIVEKKLLSLNITPLYFKWHKDKPQFIELEKLINKKIGSP